MFIKKWFGGSSKIKDKETKEIEDDDVPDEKELEE